MKEILLNLLYAVLTVGVPFLTACLARYLRAKWQKTDADASDAAEESALSEIARAVTNAVAMVSQTFVDELKKSGAFDPEAQKEALQKAIQAALNALSIETRSFIQAVYGSLESYLTTCIEAEVRTQKQRWAA